MGIKKKKGKKGAGPPAGGSAQSDFTTDYDGGGGDDGGGGGGGGGGCFQSGTEIIMGDGIKPIQDVKVGDKVMSKNLKTDVVETAVVWGLSTHESNKDGLIINGLIKTTTNHPFYLEGEWVTAGELKLGDKIMYLDGELHEIHSLELDDNPYTVYNFEVTNTHNYYADGYLVHNANKGEFDQMQNNTVTQHKPEGDPAPIDTGSINALKPGSQWKQYKQNNAGMASNSLIDSKAGKKAKAVGTGKVKPSDAVGKVSPPAGQSAVAATPSKSKPKPEPPKPKGKK